MMKTMYNNVKKQFYLKIAFSLFNISICNETVDFQDMISSTCFPCNDNMKYKLQEIDVNQNYKSNKSWH